MRAVVVRSFGGPEVLEVAEVPAPLPGRARFGSGSRRPR